MSSRIGKGPWARALGAVLVPDDSTAEAIRGEELWRQGAVRDLRVEPGQITARVDDCGVTISSATIPPRIWDAVVGYARGRGVLEQAVRGEAQSVQLEHVLAQDWDQPLIPPASALHVSCTREPDLRCPHLAAVAHALAGEIDSDPSIVVRWRTGRESHREAATADSDAWDGVAVRPEQLLAGARQTESVLKRLGQSGIHTSSTSDLADALAPAYASFARPGG